MATQDLLIIERLTRVEEKIDSLLNRALDQSSRLDDHEGRVRVLEAGRSHLLGIAALATFIGAVTGGRIVELIF